MFEGLLLDSDEEGDGDDFDDLDDILLFEGLFLEL